MYPSQSSGEALASRIWLRLDRQNFVRATSQQLQVTRTVGVHRNLAKFHYEGGSVAEWLACWTRAQKGRCSNRSRDAVG